MSQAEVKLLSFYFDKKKNLNFATFREFLLFNMGDISILHMLLFFLTSFLLLLPLVPVWKLSYTVAPFLSVLLWWPIQIHSNTRRNVKVVNSNRTFNNWGFSPGLSWNFLPQTHLYTPLCPDSPIHASRTGRDFQ